MKDHEKFIHFFLSQMYAPLHQLGIDTSMTIVGKSASGELIYDITVHNAKADNSESFVFRTDGLINDDGAQYLIGRGTRIWRVNRLVDGKPNPLAPGRVLKDSWVDEDLDREGDILQSIVNEPGVSEEKQQVIAALFLTPVVNGDVVIEGKRDSTHGCITDATVIPDATPFPVRIPPGHQPSHKDGMADPTTQSFHQIVPATEGQRAEIRNRSRKQHYRIVYVEECEPLSKQTSLLKVFKCLKDMTSGVLIDLRKMSC